MKLLLTAAGKRIQLIKHLKESFEVIAADSDSLVAAASFADKFYLVPRYDEEKYIDTLLEICLEEKIDILLPLFEREFILLNENRFKFQQLGVTLLLSSKEVVAAFNDKWLSYEFFIKNSIATPASYTKDKIYEHLHNKIEIKYPLIIKPRDGMGSSNVFKAKNEKELLFFMEYVEEPIIQEFVKGTEYTVDVFCDEEGTVISAVPRIRLQVRAGEVSKTKSVNNKEIINRTLEICSKIKFLGPVTIQFIEDKNNIWCIEVNPRVGGGVPLSFSCGINYGELITKLVKGEALIPMVGYFEEKIMIRYDEAVIL